nr:cuticle collagen 2-like [Microcebus murinus]
MDEDPAGLRRGAPTSFFASASSFRADCGGCSGGGGGASRPPGVALQPDTPAPPSSDGLVTPGPPCRRVADGAIRVASASGPSGGVLVRPGGPAALAPLPAPAARGAAGITRAPRSLRTARLRPAPPSADRAPRLRACPAACGPGRRDPRGRAGGAGLLAWRAGVCGLPASPRAAVVNPASPVEPREQVEKKKENKITAKIGDPT